MGSSSRGTACVQWLYWILLSLATPSIQAQASEGDAACGGLGIRFLRTSQGAEADHASRVLYTPAGDRIVLAHTLSHNLVVLDASSLAVVKVIYLSEHPTDVAVSPDGLRALTANFWSDSCTLVDLAAGAPIAVLPVGRGPGVVRITPNGSRAVVGNAIDQSFSIIDLALPAVTHSLTGAGFDAGSWSDIDFGLQGLGMTPFELVSDSTLVHLNAAASRIEFFDLASGKLSSWSCAPNPRGIAVTPDRKLAVVSHASQPVITRVDLQGLSVLNTVYVGLIASGPISMRPDGKVAVVAGTTVPFAYAVCSAVDLVSGTNTLLETGPVSELLSTANGQYALAVGQRGALISYASNSIVADVNGVMPAMLGAVSPNSPRALLVGGNAWGARESFVGVSTSVPPLPAGALTPIAGPPEADHTWRVAITPDGKRAVAVNALSDNASIVDVAAGEPVALVPTGKEPIAVDVSPDGSKAVVGAHRSPYATVIDLASFAATNVPISRGASQVAISPDSRWAYLSVSGDPCGVWRIDLQTLTVAGPMLTVGRQGVLHVPQAQYGAITLSHDGSTLVTCDTGDPGDQVTLIDTVAWSVTQTLQTSTSPFVATFSADDQALYVGCWTMLFEARRSGPAWQITRSLPTGPCLKLLPSLSGTRLYIGEENELSVVDTTSLSLVAYVPSGFYTLGVAESASGSHLLAAATRNNWTSMGGNQIRKLQGSSFRLIDAATLQVVEEIQTPYEPVYQLAVSRAGGFVLAPSPWGEGLVQIHLPASTGTYCAASATSIPGCTASLSAVGCASVASPSGFMILSGPVPGGGGAAIAYFGSSGPAAVPFGTQGGMLCVQSPVHRSSPLFLGGTPGSCNGAFLATLAELLAPNPSAIQAGDTIYSALWFRDPPSPDGFGLTNGLWFEVVP